MSDSRVVRWVPVTLAAVLLRGAAPAPALEEILFWPAQIDVLSAVPAPSGILRGDFDEDGQADFVVLSDASDSVAFYRGGRPDGFDFTSRYEAGFQQVAGVMEDFDDDGHLDVATANYLGDDVTVLFGRGDGTFEPTLHYVAGNGPIGLGAVDLNGDRLLDLVTSDYWTRAVTMLLNDGEGAFEAGVPLWLDGGPTALAAGDLDRDGAGDLVLSLFQRDVLEVFLGDGAGGMAYYDSVHTDRETESIRIGDFDEDGIPDILSFPGSRISVFPGLGNGSFGTPIVSDLSINDLFVEPVDYDHDGHVDLLASERNGVAFVRGEGDGTFSADTTVLVGGSPRCALLGDFNDDGSPDLITTRPDAGSVTMLTADGEGGYRVAPLIELPGRPAGVVPGDYDEDGRLDLAIAFSGNDAGPIEIYRGSGDGSFERFAGTPLESYPNHVIRTDLDEDGHLDLVAVKSAPGAVTVLLGDGAGGFVARPLELDEFRPVWATVEDFDEDGFPDVAIADRTSTDPKVLLLLGNGSGQLEIGPSMSLESLPNRIEAADFDDDGHADLGVDIWGPYPVRGVFQVLRGNGDGTFSAGARAEFDPTTTDMAVGDYDADGRSDVALLRSKEVDLLFGRGDGTFEPPFVLQFAVGPTSLENGDFNGDGGTDLAIGFGGARHVRLLVSNPAGEMTVSEIAYGTGTGCEFLGAGDFDGDGGVDLVVLSRTVTGIIANGLAVLLNTSGATGIDPPGSGGPETPRGFSLAQNYPNPFNPSTTIRYEIPAGPDYTGPDRPEDAAAEKRGAVPVSLVVFDLRGRLVRTLVDETRAPGRHEVAWDGRDDRGVPVASGIYLYRLEAREKANDADPRRANGAPFVETRKMVIVR